MKRQSPHHGIKMDFLQDKAISVIVHPNSPRNEIKAQDPETGAYRVNISAPAEKGRSNKELLKFLKKETGRECRIISGAGSRKKLLRFL